MFKRTLATLVVVVFASLTLACSEEDVGVPCDRDMTAVDPATASSDVGGNVRINAQALSCRSRLCILYSSQSQPLCTAPCDSASDCPDSTPTCPGGFACVVGQAVEGGGLGCCKLCVCKEFLPDPSKDPQAKACEGKNRTCPNI